MRIIQISDTHGFHHQLTNLPEGDVLIHCGDFSHNGTEDEVLDFLNWYIDLPYTHKIFVTGNHDLCLRDAEGIEDLPYNVHFLQDRGTVIDGISFWGLGYNHDEKRIPSDVDVLITHEPPIMILDKSNGVHWGNELLRNRVLKVKPKHHLFGHAHSAHGTYNDGNTVYSNGSLLDDKNNLIYEPIVINFEAT